MTLATRVVTDSRAAAITATVVSQDRSLAFVVYLLAWRGVSGVKSRSARHERDTTYGAHAVSVTSMVPRSPLVKSRTSAHAGWSMRGGSTTTYRDALRFLLLRRIS